MTEEVSPSAGPNGQTKMVLAKIISAVVVSCVFIEGSVALAALKWGVQDWNIVNNLATNLNTIATVAIGGLIALAKGQEH